MAEPKLTPEVHEAIVRQLQLNNYIETAAAVAGVTSRSVRNWMRRGRAAIVNRDRRPEEEVYASFARDVERAQGQAEARLLGTVTAATKDDWKAATWQLERKYPKRWGPRISIHVKEQIDEFLDRLESSLDPDTFERVLRVATSHDDDDLDDADADGAGAAGPPEPGSSE